MALTPDEIAAALRLEQETERIMRGNKNWMTAAQEAADRMRDIIDPPALRRMREMQEQLMAIVDAPYLRELREGHERIQSLYSVEQVKTLADAFAGVRAIDPAVFGGRISGRLAEELKLLDLPVDHLAGLKALMPAEHLSATIAKSLMVDDTSRDALERSAYVLKSLEIPSYATEVERLSRMSLETEKLLATLDVDRGFADLLSVHDVTRSLLEYETGRLNRAYSGFSTSIANHPDWLAKVPDFVITTPADIVFSQARFVRTVTTHEEVEGRSAADEIWTEVKERTLGYIEAVLPEVSSRLMKSWEGVWETARRRGPDWARQAGASLRFILIEVLDTVAPVNTLKDIPKEYYRDGKIMRPGQIHWLCVPLRNRTYRRVARADLESAISIIDAMSEAVHRDDYVEIEDAFDTMAVRASIALSNLLKLWKARK